MLYLYTEIRVNFKNLFLSQLSIQLFLCVSDGKKYSIKFLLLSSISHISNVYSCIQLFLCLFDEKKYSIKYLLLFSILAIYSLLEMYIRMKIENIRLQPLKNPFNF